MSETTKKNNTESKTKSKKAAPKKNMGRKKATPVAPKADVAPQEVTVPEEKSTATNDVLESTETVPLSPSRLRHIEESKKKQAVHRQYNEEKEELSHILSTLNVVIRKKQVCTGLLSGVFLSPEGNVLGITYFEKCTVYIPFDEMYIEYPIVPDEGESRKATMIRERQVLQSMVGSTIEFVVRSMHFSDYENDPYPALSASRRDALMYLQRHYYGGDNNQRKPLVKTGDIRDARILNVSANTIRVTLYGIDVSIPKRFLSYNYLGNLDQDENYCIGDKIPVSVVKIEQQENGLYTALFNAKIPQHKEFAARLLNLPVGTTVMARISKINLHGTQNGAPYISLWIPEPGVPAYAYSVSKGAVKTPLHPGDVVLLNILSIGGMDGYSAFGVIIKKIKSYEGS